jgi:enoyl-CoA hydratase/carnithine racemase
MIARAVPPSELADAAGATARELASLPTAAIAYTKQLLNRSFELDLESFLFEERAIQALLSTSAGDAPQP